MFAAGIKLRRRLFLTVFIAAFFSGCAGIFKTRNERPVLLRAEDATLERLLGEVNRFARINTLRAKMDLKFEDNSFAELGLAEAYRTADSEIVVQRPAKILFKVQAPFVGADIVQMSSDGEKFRVAVLRDNSGGRFKKFVSGTNNADYAALQEEIKGEKAIKQTVGAFGNLRPQHFTEALLVRAVDAGNYSYSESAILLEENETDAEKSKTKRILRGYYLLDEFQKTTAGGLDITRRFWFDRADGVRLVRQQIFDARREIESDIVYKNTGDLTKTGEYQYMPLRIEITRPQEKYKISLTYQFPEAVMIGKSYPAEAFVLENKWNLELLDLDRMLEEAKRRKTIGGESKANF